MKNQKRLFVALLFAMAGLCPSAAILVGGEPEMKGLGDRLGLKSSDAQVGAFASQISRTLVPIAREHTWRPKVSEERSRGPALLVYPKVAPATVVVRCGDGHGTGFFVDPDGWILTNHHVVALASIDPETSAQVANIHVGRFVDGWMQMNDEVLPAFVYKSSEDLDLALLKLDRMPSGMKKVPAIPLADRLPLPGSDCIAIGHPAAGMLWTVRSGELAGSGIWPSEMIDVVMATLAAQPEDREDLKRILASAPRRKVLLSSCGLNPGDSGGPLVDDEGRLIGVSFAIPRSTDDAAISLDKFSYHVHLAEVKSFLEDRPLSPPVRAPDPWPPGLYYQLVDVDEDGTDDAMVFSIEEQGQMTGVLVDLDGDSGTKTAIVRFFDPDATTQWDFEFAVQDRPVRAAFYDSDADGVVDLILMDSDDDTVANGVLRQTDGKWKAEKAEGRKMVDVSHFTSKRLARRFKELGFDKP